LQPVSGSMAMHRLALYYFTLLSINKSLQPANFYRLDALLNDQLTVKALKATWLAQIHVNSVNFSVHTVATHALPTD